MAATAQTLKHDPKKSAGLRESSTAVQLFNAEMTADLTAAIQEGDWSQQNPVFKAAHEGDIKKVQEYLTQNKNKVDIIARFGTTEITLLQIAAMGNQLEVVKLIVESQKEKLKAFTRKEQCIALIFAISYAKGRENLQVAKYLIEQEAYAKSSVLFKSKPTPLMVAAKQGYFEIVERLISKKLVDISEIDARDSEGNTALMLAAKCGRNPRLLKVTSTTASDFAEALKETEKKLLQESQDLELGNQNPGNQNQNSGSDNTEAEIPDKDSQAEKEIKEYEKIVEMLLKKDADIGGLDKDGRTVLMLGVLGGSTKIVGLLLNNNAVRLQINHIARDHFTASWYAIIKKQDAIFFLLFEAGANPIILGKDLECPPLHFLINCNRNIKILESFLEKTSNIDEADKDGETALHQAAILRWEAAINLLISKGAKVNKKTKKGNTPLNLIAKHDVLVNSTKLLLANNANVSLEDNQGTTPLMVAAFYGAFKTFIELLNAGADLYARDKKRRTVLMYAAAGGNLEIVRELISQMLKSGKMELEVLCDSGCNALIWACQSEKDEPEILRLLAQDPSFDVNREFLETSEFDGKPSEFHCTALFAAAFFGEVKQLEFLLSIGANPFFKNKKDNSSLNVAVQKGHVACVALLLKVLLDKAEENRVSVLTEISSSLDAAAQWDHPEIFKMLFQAFESLKKGELEDQEQIIMRCFKLACRKKSKNILKHLLSDKNCSEIIKRYANELLFEAVFKDNQTMVEVLLGNESLNANINFKQAGLNLLIIAIMREKSSIATLLIEKGIDLEGVYETEIEATSVKDEEDFIMKYSVTPLMLASQGVVVVKDEQEQEQAQKQAQGMVVSFFHNPDLASAILAKKIWIALKESYIKGLLLNLPRTTKAHVFLEDLKLKIQKFAENIIALRAPFDIQDNIHITCRDPRDKDQIQLILFFPSLLEVFKKVYEIQRDKGTFNYSKLTQFISSNWAKFETNFVREKKNALDLENSRKERLILEISPDAIKSKFSPLLKELDLQFAVLFGDGKESKESQESEKMGVTQRLKAGIAASNSFLDSEVAFERMELERLAKLKDGNNRFLARIDTLSQEMHDLKAEIQNLEKTYLARFLELAKGIREKLETQGIEAAEKSLEILNEDKLLLQLLQERNALDAEFRKLPDEFSRMEQNLNSQRETEKALELKFQKKKEQAKQEAEKERRLEKLRVELKKKAEEDRLRLEAELSRAAEELKRRKEILQARKEEQRRHALTQDEERKKKKELELALKLESQKTQTSKEPKDAGEAHALREMDKRRKRFFPLTVASKSSLYVLLGLSPEARVLKKILEETEILSTQDFHGNAADKLGSRKSCLGMMGRITEIIFRKGGLPSFSIQEAEHFRDVIWHAESQFLAKFSDEEIFNLTKILAQYVFAVLRNDKKNAPKYLLLLKRNETFMAFLKHDLKLEQEPFEYEYYDSERKLEKDQEKQLEQCQALSAEQLEHARGHSVGRIGGFIRRIQKHYKDAYRKQKAEFEQDLELDRVRAERENYLDLGGAYRHVETMASGFEITERMNPNLEARESKLSAERGAEPSHGLGLEPANGSGNGSVSRSFLPKYSAAARSSGAPASELKDRVSPAVPSAAATPSTAATPGPQSKKGKQKAKRKNRK